MPSAQQAVCGPLLVMLFAMRLFITSKDGAKTRADYQGHEACIMIAIDSSGEEFNIETSVKGEYNLAERAINVFARLPMNSAYHGGQDMLHH